MATAELKFKKKTGTSGISGQLYETKLISLILFKLLHDDDIKEFYLASNMDGIGSFDDICLKLKISGNNKPILVFLQAKHKDGNKSNLDYDLIKNFHISLAQVKEQFNNNIKTEDKKIKEFDNVFFEDSYDDIECLFILYTNGKYLDVANTSELYLTASSTAPKIHYSGLYYDTEFAEKLNDLLATNKGSKCCHLRYSDEELEYVGEKILEEEIIVVAEHFCKFLNDNEKQSMNIMLDEYMLRYHVVLRQYVLDVSPIQPHIQQKQEVGKQEITQEQQLGKKQTVQRLEHCKEQTMQQQEQELGKEQTVQQPELCKGKTMQEQELGKQQTVQQPELCKGKTMQHQEQELGKEQTMQQLELCKEQTKQYQEQQLVKQQTVQQQQQDELSKEQIVKQQKQGRGKQQTVQQQQQDELNKEQIVKQQKQGRGKQQTVQNTTEKWRFITFKPSFFETDDHFLTLFRNKIYETLIKNRGNTKKTVNKSTENISLVNIDNLVSTFLMEPSAMKLSYLIDTYVTYVDDKLKFLVDRPITDLEQLDQIKILPVTVKEAQIINFLRHLKLKVPISFGNLDMTLRGNQKKMNTRLGQLTSFLCDLCQKSESEDSYQIIIIDENIDKDYLSISGGIGGAVGNLIVHDKVTKLMKFTEDSTSLQENAKSLFNQLNKNIKNLNSYRFKIKNICFPKIEFECTDEAKDIFTKLLVYEKQRNQSGVEVLLIEHIKEHEKCNTTQVLPTKLESISVYYHHEIQQWWLSPIKGTYLTKTSKIYQKAINNIIIEPQMCALQNTYFINLQNRIYVFNENSIKSFDSLDTFSNIIIITDVASLMILKVIQYLRNKDLNEYIVLDLKYLINLPIKEYRALNLELNDTEKIIIIVFDGLENSGAFYKRLLTIAQAVEEKKVILVASNDFITVTDAKELMEYFPQINNVLEDQKVILTDFVLTSQNEITENAKVIFQGQETCLKSIVQEDSLVFVKGLLLNKIICNETIVIGEPLTDNKYEEIKYFYVDRRLKNTQKSKSDIYVRTLNDIEDNNVLITAEPGMGKSLLLTHLSIKTKEYDNIWILRINLLDYSKEFHVWQNSKMIINASAVIKFLCKVVTKNKNIPINLKEANNKVYLQDCTGDELGTFELNIFLQYYNNGKLLLLFDGFDEICPHYKDNVLKLLAVVMNLPQKNKMWVTSRPYDEILPDLEKVLGKAYKIEYINNGEQENYLNNIWKSKLDVKKLNDIQLSNLISFGELILDKILTKTFPISMHFTFIRMYYLFYDFIERLFNNDSIMLPEDMYEETTAPVASTSAAESIPFSKIVDQLVGTPLLLFLVAEYFVNITTNVEIKEWDLDINIIKIYESFIETKLKNILFEEKNKIDIYKPDVITRYEKDRDECIAMHKKLAAYAVLKDKIFCDVCPIDEFKDMQPFNDELELETVINTIKCGTEKTGLINYVTLDNIPVFIHKTFGEYFASEYICDIFKSSIEFDCKKVLYTAVYVYGGMDIRPWVNEKMKLDDELNVVIRNIWSKKLVVLSWHREFFSRGDWGMEHLLKLLSSGPEDYEVDWCSNTTEDFAYTLNVLNPEERRREIKKFQAYVIAKMKPHLKQHFTGRLQLRGYRQMINWMVGKIDLP